MISTLRSVFINDDKVTFTGIFPSQYNVFTYSPFEIIRAENLKYKNITIDKAATCCGSRYIALTGLPADPHFDSRSVLVRDHDLKDDKDREIFRHAFDQHILSLRLTPKYLLCGFFDHIEIWELATSKKYHEILHSINIHAPLEISQDFSVFACTGATSLEICVVNLANREHVTFRAVDNPLSVIAYSGMYKYYATTSSTGHVIKVWRTDDNQVVAKFKRGATAAVIYSFGFSPNNDYLAVVSQNGTLHFFDLRKVNALTSSQDQHSGPSIQASNSNFITARALHKIGLNDQSPSYVTWISNSRLAVVTMSGKLIVLTVDEANCHEVGREQTVFKNYVTEGVYTST